MNALVYFDIDYCINNYIAFPSFSISTGKKIPTEEEIRIVSWTLPWDCDTSCFMRIIVVIFYMTAIVTIISYLMPFKKLVSVNNELLICIYSLLQKWITDIW